jgi:N utilization substance protein A
MENSEPVPLVEINNEQKPLVEEEEDLGDEIDEETKKIRFNAERHMMIEDAKKINKKIELEQELLIDLKEEDSFTRIAAQSAKQTIIQQLRELEKENIISEFENKEGEIVSGIIQKVDRGTVIVHLGKAPGILPAKEAIPFERFQADERKKFLILGIREMKGSLGVLLSRTHPQFIVKLLSLEVPEIQEGIVEIKAIAREPGYRTKIAVSSNQPEVDAVGSCIGPKGVRVNTLVEEIPNEKIDVVEYSEEPATFVANALSPVKIKETEIDPGKKEVKVFVSPDLLSAVIGKNGQNVRLASKLTGWNIKVYSTVAPDFEQANTEAEKKEEETIDEGFDENAEETLEVKKKIEEDENEIEINKE